MQADASGQPDVPGFGEFYDAQRVRALRLAHLITGSQSIGQEVVQEAFLAVHSKWASISSHDAYLRATVVNLSRGYQRRAIRERRALDRRVDRTTSIPELDEMWRFIVALPVEQRAVLVMRFYEDLSLAEIANVLDKPIGTIKSIQHRALSRLKENLDE